MTTHRRSDNSSAGEPDTNPANIQEQIRQRAYQLYEERGRQEGFSEQDWLRAETEILRRTFKAAA